MKKPYLLIVICSLSTLTVGCGSNSPSDSIGRLQAASLMDNCLTSTSSGKGERQFDTATLNIRSPEPNEFHVFGNFMTTSFASDSLNFEKYQSFLDKAPFIKVATIEMKSANHVATCDYVFFDDNQGNLQKFPYLIRAKDKQNTISRQGEYIQAVSVKDYVFNYVKSRSGLSYHDLVIKYQYKDDSNNKKNIGILKDVLMQQSFTNKFQPLAVVHQQLHANSAVELADLAVKSVLFPDYVPENPIYVAPVINTRQVQRLGNFQASDRAVKQMDQFNEQRYVDSDTGIATRSDVLAQIKNEYGIGVDPNEEGNTIVSFEDNGDVIDGPATLRMKGDEYFDNGQSNELRMRN